MKKFIDLAYHIIAMENDSYLAGHPEWNEFVTEAKEVIGTNDELVKALDKLLSEYEYALNILAEASGMTYSENDFVISNKALLKKITNEK